MFSVYSQKSVFFLFDALIAYQHYEIMRVIPDFIYMEKVRYSAMDVCVCVCVCVCGA
jgi:hypothetical protein